MQRKEYQLASCQISRKRRGHASLPAVENGSTVVVLLLCSQNFDSCFYFQDVIDYICVFLVVFSVYGGGCVCTQLYWSVFCFDE